MIASFRFSQAGGYKTPLMFDIGSFNPYFARFRSTFVAELPSD
jgi:hypothetical protein